MRRKFSEDEVIARAKLGMALNLHELAIATGYGYSTIRTWHENGMPLLDGRITLKEALAWRKQYEQTKQLGLQSQIPTVLHHPLLTSGKSGVPA
jgi:hypothetical protein